MKIKRFVAPDMRTAFRMVRDEHGPDAVILSNRRTDEGIEIVAASNYDEALVQQALDAARPEEPAPRLQVSAANPAPRAAKSGATANPAMAMMAAISERRSPATAGMAQPAPARPLTQPAAIAVSAMPAGTAPAPSRPAAAPQAPAPAPAAAPFAEFRIPEDVFRNAPISVPMASPFAAAASAAASAAAVPAWLEDIAAVSLSPATTPGAPTAPSAEPIVAATAPAPVAASAGILALPALTPVPSFPAAQNDEQLTQLRDELALMRQMIEREMNRLTDERLRGSPVRAQALELMDDYGFDSGLIRDVVMQIPADLELHRGRGLMLGLLSKRLPIAPLDPIEEGGVIALIGPTGAGKTTTIAKLASRFLERHAARDVALVTTDTIRVGGREQLHSYGRQLGIAVHEADSDAALQQLLERLRDYKLVLIDTAGMGQRDRALAAQLHWLRASRVVRSLLVLPANAHFSDLDEVVRRFAGADPQGVILTKLDETGRFGSALSVVADHRLPITWVTDGQRVPDDLHRANAASLVLRLEDLRRAADKPCTPEQNHAVA
ncbi:flagellar biosynthesis protein FlhF [Xanthomonas translucens]|uniref:Flagellar biosynthesis protein FlhF n=11 Tax=Xanthomonas campestris pv. translucens TaxID=343 RepID=A0A1C3TPB6_XANCT|nr:flagellar biosynthesis protein FlhF [Xanthomonas translucens]MCS3361068.1 flagellar biosynthesis protein FlhF [Xanthomonas translucens pv. translucens]MCS3373519.1 flagellar biosynthesis protein FlhF [Xanthomonas translucens pv. translucens]MCT8274707.1 flagellar biosynthesis protein FlhF [Xanthomonas translucens pv. translucens]MCT8279901.1 flagellar biosynthesis protein FlhF [Xanthomonas translucens pv. translucens]MCT8287144.1 flagellar biosynthesis protein FlhF [Xanthomonas translucens 